MAMFSMNFSLSAYPSPPRSASLAHSQLTRTLTISNAPRTTPQSI